MRRFAIGERGDAGGIQYRITGPGRHGPYDYVLELYGPTGWVRASMRTCALMVDFFQENEEACYPQDAGNLGRRKFFNFLRRAIDVGWESACSEMEPELRRAAERRAQEGIVKRGPTNGGGR